MGKWKFNTKTVTVVLILILSLSAVLMFYGRSISGNDFWWHVKVGENIVENGKVPTHDIFSWWGKENNIPWTAHEWLSDLAFYGLMVLGGTPLVYLVCLVAAMGLITVIWLFSKDHQEKNVLAGGLFFICLTVVAQSVIYPRPQLFSFFLLALELKILYNFYEDEDDRWIFILPLLSTIWSNLHGGFSPLAYGLPIMFLVAGAINFRFGRITAERMSKKALTRLGIVSALCVVGILINPIGFKVLIYPFQNLGDSVSMNNIVEWAAPDAKSAYYLLLAFIPMALMALCVIAGKEDVRLIDIFVCGFFTLLFLRSRRFLFPWYIAASFYVFRYMPTLNIKESTSVVGKACLVIAIVIAMFPGMLNISNVIKTAVSGQSITFVLEDDMVEYVKKDNAKRLYNGYNYGESLIYNDIDTFFDARADLFAPSGVLADGFSIGRCTSANATTSTTFDVKTLLDKYDFDAMLVSRTSAIYSYLKISPEWKCAYENMTSAYFKTVKK